MANIHQITSIPTQSLNPSKLKHLSASAIARHSIPSMQKKRKAAELTYGVDTVKSLTRPPEKTFKAYAKSPNQKQNQTGNGFRTKFE